MTQTLPAPARAPLPAPTRIARRAPPDAQAAASIDARHIVFFLDDALPEHLAERMERTPEAVTMAEALASLCEFQGSCALQYSWNAKSVEDALRAHDGQGYRLLTWRVLPNHVHVLLEPGPDWPAGDPIHRWKQASSPRRKGAPRPGLRRFGPDQLRPRAARLQRPRQDEFWADEDFARILHTRREVEHAKLLIEAISPPESRLAPPARPEPAAPAPLLPVPASLAALATAIRPGAGPRSKVSRPGEMPRRRLNRWLDEVVACAVYVATRCSAFALVVWVIALVRHALARMGVGF
jgi:REP element-mobilizing transposase RayT